MEQNTKAPCCTRLQQSVELHARLHAACRTYRVLKKGEWVAGTTVLLFFLLAGGRVGGRLGLLLSQLLAQAIQLAPRHQDDCDPGLMLHVHHSVCQALSGRMVGVLSRPFRCSVSHRARALGTQAGEVIWRSRETLGRSTTSPCHLIMGIFRSLNGSLS